MIISVASGKGGTGKTTVSTSLALSLKGDVQLLDCDVEEPNAHIFIRPDILEKETVSVPVPEIDERKCVYCGKCSEVCAYNAIAVLAGQEGSGGNALVFPELCHGCGACMYFCPESAISERYREIGVVETGTRGALEFIHGKLNIGEAMAPPLIRAVKKKINKEKTVVVDAPPGTTCPVITSITGSDYCVLVTEPTPFGLNDLKLAVEVLDEMLIPFGVIVNRAGLGDDKTYSYCERENIPVLMNIPFKREIAEAYSRGIPLVESFPEIKDEMLMAVDKIKEAVG